MSAGPSHAQNSPLNNISTVRVVVAWAGATDTDKAAVLSDAQLKLRLAGIGILGPDEKSVVSWPTLFIGIGPGTTAVPLIVELTEEAYLNRDIVARGKYTVSAAYFIWPNLTTPAGRPVKEHMMDLEVQAAMRKTKILLTPL